MPHEQPHRGTCICIDPGTLAPNAPKRRALEDQVPLIPHRPHGAHENDPGEGRHLPRVGQFHDR